jgi:hypothetical protein
LSAKDKQVGGNHYQALAIQPAEFIHKNGIGFLAGNIIKYVCRYKQKGGIQDLEKAKHYVEMLIEFESVPERVAEKLSQSRDISA